MPSRERYSAPATFSSPNPLTNQRAETTLSLQSLGRPLLGRVAGAVEAGELRVRCRGCAAAAPLKLGLSGQMPVSTTPTTTPCPARCGPPCRAQTPSGPARSRRSRELLPTTGAAAALVRTRSTRCLVLRSTSVTPGVTRAARTWSLVSVAAKPFSAVV